MKAFLIVFIAGSLAANAQQPTRASHRFGDPSVSPHFQGSSVVMDDFGVAQFQDADVAVAVDLMATSFSVSLENYTSGPIKLDWNVCSFVGPDGRSHRIIHSGVKFTDRELPMAPLTIAPGANHFDVLVPAEYAHYISTPPHWEVAGLLPDADQQIGKTVTVFIPLDIKGVIRNYSFRIKILAKGKGR